MIHFFSWLWGLCQQAVGLVFPVFAQARELPLKHWPALRVALTVLLSALFVASGYAIVKWQGLENVWAGRLRGLEDYWLALLFLFVLLFGWFVHWLLLLLRRGPAYSPYPDIDAAWRELVDALTEAEIGLTDPPVFLCLGSPLTGEQPLFNGSRLTYAVAHTARNQTRLSVYATREPAAVFVTCRFISLLGRMVAELARAKHAPAAPARGPDEPNRQSLDIRMSMGAEDIRRLIATIQRQPLESPNPEGADPVRQQVLSQLTAAIEPQEVVEARQRPLQQFVQNRAAMREALDRLRHLCGLIARDRAPDCPVNGVVLLLPLVATSPQCAAHAAVAVREELAAVRAALRMHFPTVALICDMERADGFAEFLQRFRPEEREARLGRAFPWVPSEPPGQWPELLDRFGRWICREYFSYLVYQRLDLEAAREAEENAVRTNARLFGLIHQMANHSAGLAQVLREGLAPSADRPLLFGGCYLAATGESPAAQGFLRGVFDRIAYYDARRDDNMQNMVYWTEEARQEDRDRARRTVSGYLAGGAALAASLAFLAYAICRSLRVL